MNNSEAIRRNFAVMLVATSLAFLPFSKLICHVSLTLYIALWLTEGQWSEKFRIVKNRFTLLFLVGWMTLTIAGLFTSSSDDISFWSLEKKIFLFLLPVCVATSRINFSLRDIRMIFYGFTVVCFGIIMYSSFHAWMQWREFNNDVVAFQRVDFLNSSDYFINHPEVSKSWVFFTYTGLASAVQLHPSYFSLYVAFCVIFLLTEMSQRSLFRYHHSLTTLLIGIFLAALVFLSSRIIILGIASILAALCIFALRIQQSRKQITLIVILFVGLVAGVFMNPISRHRNWKELTSMSYEVTGQTHYRTSSEIRASLWWLGWKSFQQVNPFLGAGADNVESVMKEQAARFEITNVLGTHDPHNQFIFILIANGLPGLILFTGILAGGFLQALRGQDVLLFCFLALFTLLCVTESALELQKGIVFFSLVFSLLTFRQASDELSPSSISFANAGN